MMVSEDVSAGAATYDRIETLYMRHADGALRFAYLITGSREAAEDAVQDAFLRVFGRFGDLRNADAFGAYLRRTIVNLDRGSRRRRKTESSKLPKLLAGTAPEHSAAVDERRDVLAALLKLPVRQRAALVLRYYEDLSESRSAEILGCSLSALKSLVARGSDALRGELEGSHRGT